MKLSRRAFMQLSAAGVGTAFLNSLTPRVVLADGPADVEQKVLVCSFLGGGLDDLSAFPYMGGALEAALAARRGSVHVPPSAALNLNGVIGLHPGFGDGVRQLHLQDGALKVICSTGLFDGNGSHEVESNRLVTIGGQEGDRSGFLGRLMSLNNLNTFQVLGIQPGQGLALTGADRVPLMMNSLDEFKLNGRNSFLSDSADRALSRQISESLIQLPISVSPEEKAARQTLELMYNSIDQVNSLAGATVGLYPSTGYGQALRDAARIVRGKQQAGIQTSTILYIDMGGFDTHGDQPARLNELIPEIGEALVAFTNDMKSFGLWNKTAMLYITEFGRTLATGAEGGTDHGHGCKFFVAGGSVDGAGPNKLIAGVHPTENELKTGFSQPVRIDCRNVYSECISWLGMDPDAVFPAPYTKVPLGIFKA